MCPTYRFGAVLKTVLLSVAATSIVFSRSSPSAGLSRMFEVRGVRAPERLTDCTPFHDLCPMYRFDAVLKKVLLLE
jgi:hypothetical protein